jgi:hypothetical protein
MSPCSTQQEPEMTKKLRRPKAGPPNLAARALGTKIFALKVVTPNKAYSRKVKHPKGSAKDEPLPFSFLVQDELQ